MKTSKLDAAIIPDNLDAFGYIGKLIRDKTEGPRRRYMAAINSRGRTLNLDRRVIDRDRRIAIVYQYNGYSRREIIGRREHPEDRRT